MLFTNTDIETLTYAAVIDFYHQVEISGQVMSPKLAMTAAVKPEFHEICSGIKTIEIDSDSLQ